MKKQIVWLDAVRLLAFFFLLCCHAADPFYATATYANADAGGSVDPLMLMWGERWMAFVRPCVPLFVMITGALMFPVRMPMGAFYKKRILRVLWPFLIWSVLYYLFPWFTGLLGLDKSIVYKCFIWAESDSQSFASSLANILRIPYTFSFIAQHMWYIYMLIGLYLYLPVFSAWVERATKKQMQVFLGLWMLSTLLPYFHQFVSPYAFGTCTWNSFGLFYYFAGFNGYLLLGHYLRHHVSWSLSRTWPVTLVLLVAGFLVTYLGYGHIMSLPEKTPEQIEGIRRSGVVNTGVLDEVARQIHAGMTTLEIDRICHDYCVGHGGVPACLGYEGFPKSVCVSINEVVCHGIPKDTVVLKEGDIVNVDFTTILDGYYADASRMYVIGKTTPEKEQLVRVARECLEIGAEAAKPYCFVGDIGHAIQKHAEKYHYGVVRDLCGHGVGLQFHEEPEVVHFGHRGTGMLLVPGMVFTIEPMINMGTWKVFIDADDEYGWEVITGDEKPSAQWEHTFLMTEHGVEILSY